MRIENSGFTYGRCIKHHERCFCCIIEITNHSLASIRDELKYCILSWSSGSPILLLVTVHIIAADRPSALLDYVLLLVVLRYGAAVRFRDTNNQNYARKCRFDLSPSINVR